MLGRVTVSTPEPFHVDLPGLLRVFGGHLYSSPDVFARELVQNAVDAIAERRRAEPGFEGTVRVRSSARDRVVEVDDDGVGLDEERIALCLAKIGYSSKTGDDGLLGRFGIGLLSGFLVAKELVVDTRRAGSPSFVWRATADGRWTIGPGTREAQGTTVRLSLAPGSERYARAEVLRRALDRYVTYLPFAVEHEGERVTRTAPWTAPGPERARAVSAWLETERPTARPLAVLPLPSGALWITSDRAAEDGGRVDVYLGGMLLERGARTLLPKWATFVSGAVEAPRLAPTASRETFVDDDAAAALREEVASGLLSELRRMPDADPAGFERVLGAHYLALRGACVDHPDLLDAIGHRVPFETNVGMTDLRAVASMAGDRATIRYVDTPQDFAHLSPLANAQGLPLVNASYVYDAAFLEAYARRRGLTLLHMTGEDVALLVQPAPELHARFARVLAAAREVLEPFEAAPELARFEPGAMPAFLASDATQVKERARTLVKQSSSSLVRSLLANLPVAASDGRARFLFNAQNALVLALPDVKDDERLRRVLRLLYARASMTLRRTLSLAETRAFSEDLLALLDLTVHARGDWN